MKYNIYLVFFFPGLGELVKEDSKSNSYTDVYFIINTTRYLIIIINFKLVVMTYFVHINYDIITLRINFTIDFTTAVRKHN